MNHCGIKLKEMYRGYRDAYLGKAIDTHVCMKKEGHKGECKCNCGKKWSVKTPNTIQISYCVFHQYK